MARQQQPTLREFLEGSPLRYRGYDHDWRECVYQFGVGVLVYAGSEYQCTARVTTDALARSLYYNLTRKPQRAEKEES